MRALEHDIDVHLYRAVAITKVSANVAVLQLEPVIATSFFYHAGQYVTVELNDGMRRVYSLATCMRADGRLELHVQLFPSGHFSQRIQLGIDELGLLKVRGPFGHCVWPDSFDETGLAIMLATGTGIAPIRALVQQALAQGKGKDIRLYWGAPTRNDLYLHDEFVALDNQYPQFHFVPVLSRESAGGDGKDGYVHQVASSQHASLAHTRVYACGKPQMVSAAATLLNERNSLPASQFYADPFGPSDTLPTPVTISDSTGPAVTTLTVNVTRPGNRVSEPLRVRADGTLLMALRDAHVIQGVCNGQQSCGTCRLTLPEAWFEVLPQATRSEARLLRALPDTGPYDRLACQIALNPGLEGMQVFTH